ncbi:MAG: ParB N-terminal domain-containing protein [Candidatus Micrarchaeota archaeon]
MMELVPLKSLRPHERTDAKRGAKLKMRILHDRHLKMPILVDGKTLVILDGHHRVECLKSLGCKFVPAMLVDYGSKEITVAGRRRGVEISKEKILDAGAKGKPFPPKSSRHTYARYPQERIQLSSLK